MRWMCSYTALLTRSVSWYGSAWLVKASLPVMMSSKRRWKQNWTLPWGLWKANGNRQKQVILTAACIWNRELSDVQLRVKFVIIVARDLSGDSHLLLEAYRKSFKWLIGSAERVIRCHFSECPLFKLSDFEFGVSELISCFNMLSFYWNSPFPSHISFFLSWSYVFRSILSRLHCLYFVLGDYQDTFFLEGRNSRLKS